MKSAYSRQCRPLCPVWCALSAALVIGLSLSNELAAHEFEDGYVERSVAFVVRDRTVSVEYSVGCNTQTMKALMERWHCLDAATTSSVAEHSANSIRQNSPPNVNAAGQMVTAVSSAKTESLRKSGKSNSTIGANETLTRESTSTSDETNPTAKPRKLSADELKTEADFRKVLLTQIARYLQIHCNGNLIDLRPVGVEPSARHHVIAAARFEIELPSDRTIHFIAADHLFAQNPGNARYALKPKGSAILLKSNVAPIIIRAPRIELEGLLPSQRIEKTTIDCKLSIVSKNQSTR